MIDSGWDRSIAEPRVLQGVGFLDADDGLAMPPSHDDHDRIGHGTACADLVLRAAPGASIVPIRVFGDRLETSVRTLIAALDWAVDQEIPIINLSLGTLDETAIRPLYAACERARQRGTIIVAAQHDRTHWSWPAIFENAIGVEAEPIDDPLAYRYRKDAGAECSANRWHRDILWLGGKRKSLGGSSFAAPIVSGAVARLLEQHPRADLDRMRELLEQNASGHRIRSRKV